MNKVLYCVGLILILLVGTAGCSKGDQQQAATVDIESETIEIKTPYGNLSYPKKYEDVLKTSDTEDENGYRLAFSTDIDDVSYPLFIVVINGNSENGMNIGQLKGNDVYVEVEDLGDLSGLSQDQQDQIYGMQEALNDLLQTK